MCGIAGLLFYRADRPEGMLQQIRLFYNCLLVQTQERGKDATGVAVIGADGAYTIGKTDKKAEEAVFTELLGDQMKRIAGNVTQVMGHCRWLTQGAAANQLNNHPIETAGDIVGIHNGGLLDDQDNVIFEVIGQDKQRGQVDSEAIFALINEAVVQEGGNDLTGDALAELVDRVVNETATILNGRFAIAVMHKRLPNRLFMARNAERPIVVAKIPQWNLFVYASEEKHIFNSILTVTQNWFLMTGETLKIDVYMSELEANFSYSFTVDEYEPGRAFTVDAKSFTQVFPVPVTTTYNNTNYNYGKRHNWDKKTIVDPPKENKLSKADQFYKTLWDVAFQAAVARTKFNKGAMDNHPYETAMVALESVADVKGADPDDVIRGLKATEILSYAYGFAEGFMFGFNGTSVYYPKAGYNGSDLHVVNTVLGGQLRTSKTDVKMCELHAPFESQILKHVLGYSYILSDEPVENGSMTTGSVKVCYNCNSVFHMKEAKEPNCPTCGKQLLVIEPNFFEPTKQEAGKQ